MSMDLPQLQTGRIQVRGANGPSVTISRRLLEPELWTTLAGSEPVDDRNRPSSDALELACE
jgi:hypothetical protein